MADCTQCGEEHRQLAEWLKELQKYKDLEEQGRLITLPCKIGDTAWDIKWWDDTTETRVIDGKTYFDTDRVHLGEVGDIIEMVYLPSDLENVYSLRNLVM